MGNTYNKLINADEAFRILSGYYHHRTETQADALREALELVPEAVVRCKDCRYLKTGENERESWSICVRKIVYPYVDVEPNDYCSYGERKTAESE